MIVEFGQFALVLALVVAVTGAFVGLWGAHARDAHVMAVAAPAAVAQAVLSGVAILALANAYITSDFSVLNVYQNSHSAKPLIYKIAGVWGNHEGSLLLWICILTTLGALVALLGRNMPSSLRSRVLGVQALITACFIAFSLFTSNPFIRLDPAPLDGQDLNPLLQDVGLAYHPPFLYLGYVGFSVAFSFGVAALLEGRIDPAWARWVRPWTLAAWTSLTLGIAMGSWWAYYELGWGGFWFWDPVENASLMPWLAGTALLHSAAVVEKRDTLKAWTILMAITAFATSMLGTFVVRSGLLTSVHAFANDPERGLLLLAISVALTGGALALYAWRASALARGGGFQYVSRESALVGNNLVLAAILFTVMIGTFWPTLVDVATGERISVGPPYFNAVTIPLAAILALLMSFGMLTPWKRGDLPAIARRLSLVGVATVVAAGAAFWLTGQSKSLAALGVAMAVWIVGGAALDILGRLNLRSGDLGEIWRRASGLRRSAWGSAIAHLGVGLVMLGVVGTTLWMTERLEVMRPGDRLEISGYTLTLEAIEQKRVANYETEMARFSVERGGRVIATMEPERRWYPVAEQLTTEAAIRLSWGSDLYIAIGDPRGEDQGARVVRAYRHPLVGVMWFGALTMVFGGLVSLTDRRYRLGAPARRRSGASPQPAPAE